MLNYCLLPRLLCCLLLWLSTIQTWAAELLPPQQAFAARVERQGEQATLVLTIAPDYYLYRQRTQISVEPPAQLGQISLPAGKPKNDPFLGPQEIYTGTVRIALPLNGPSQRFTLKAKIQGCAEAAKVCYLPYTHTLHVGPNGSQSSSLFLGSNNNALPGSEQAAGDGALTLTLGSYYLAGLALAFTACMYPLLPILSSLIAGQGARLTRRRGLLLALSYVQGLALCYTLVGIIAGLTGSLLTVWLQQPAVVITAATLMVAFALAMFGVWRMQLPSAWQTAVANASNRLPGGHYLTVFAAGTLSALIIGPCVAPPLALALGYIASTGDATLGGLALYVMALGLGTPLLIVGYFGGSILPRAGAWMQGVKNLLGVVMLGLAVYLISPFVPPWSVLLLWGALATACALWLLLQKRQIRFRLDKLLGAGLILAALAQFTGAATGGSNPLQPLPANWFGRQSTTTAQPVFIAIESVADWQRIQQQYRGQPILLDFYADWCVACKELERDTFTDARVANAMRRYVLVRADVTKNSNEHQALLRHFGLFGPPGIILTGPDGQETQRIIGFVPPETFLTQLNH